MTNSNNQISSGTRILTMILDHVFMTIITMVFAMPGMLVGIANTFSETNDDASPDMFGGDFIYFSILGYALYFCKDCIKGRSIAKRIFKLQVVNNKTNEVASPLRCFIRNITCVLWPIELIFALTNTSRRLGDRIAGTKLVMFEPIHKGAKLKIVQIIIPVIISYTIFLPWYYL